MVTLHPSSAALSVLITHAVTMMKYLHTYKTIINLDMGAIKQTV